MRKIALLTLSLFAVLAVAAQAQSTNLVVNVPFDFRIDKMAYEAGRYELIRTGSSSVPVWLFRPEAGGRVQIIVTGVTGPKPASEQPLVTFHRYGNVTFMAGIQIPGTAAGMQLTRGKLEQELAGRLAPEKATIVARTR